MKVGLAIDKVIAIITRLTFFWLTLEMAAYGHMDSAKISVYIRGFSYSKSTYIFRGIMSGGILTRGYMVM